MTQTPRSALIKSDLIDQYQSYANEAVEIAKKGIELQSDYEFLVTLGGVAFGAEDFIGENAAQSPQDIAVFMASIHALDLWMSTPVDLDLGEPYGIVTIIPGAALRLFARELPTIVGG